MTVLTTKARDKLPAKDFALSGGRYPIHDENHARNALARVSQYGTPSEKATVRRKVHARYPEIREEHEAAAKEVSKRIDEKRRR